MSRELLGPHMGDRLRQGRDHQGEPLGDPTRVDAGAVDRGAARRTGRLDGRLVPPLREEPVERCHHVGTGRQDPGHHRGVGHDRRVDDAVGPEGQQRIDVVGGGHAERADAAQLADVAVRPCPGCAPSTRRARARGGPTMPATAARPTPPVAHWITLMAIRPSPPRSRCPVAPPPERRAGRTFGSGIPHRPWSGARSPGRPARERALWNAGTGGLEWRAPEERRSAGRAAGRCLPACADGPGVEITRPVGGRPGCEGARQ